MTTSSVVATDREDSADDVVTWVAKNSLLTMQEVRALSAEALENMMPEQEVRGRGAVLRKEMPSGVRVVVRRFLRGGFVAPFIRDRYFHFPLLSPEYSRPYRELQVLEYLTEKKVRVPRPLGAQVEFTSQRFLYRGALITEEVHGAQNLMSFAEDAKKLRPFLEYCYRAGVEARRALEARVFHPDLHPGNVVVTPDGNVTLIDFDRAVRFWGDAPQVYPGKLLQRWSRAVEKRHIDHGAAYEFERGLFHVGR